MTDATINSLGMTPGEDRKMMALMRECLENYRSEPHQLIVDPVSDAYGSGFWNGWVAAWEHFNPTSIDK